MQHDPVRRAEVLRFCRLSPSACPPRRCSELAAGFDLCASEDCVVAPGGAAALVRTGLALGLRRGTVGLIKSRSSLAARHQVEAGAGVIDADYRGEVSVLLRNFGGADFVVRAGDRVAQLLVLALGPEEACEEVAGAAELGSTARGEGGFGSTGRR
jgi:dUTP pyrophosphatase